ncbi:MAG TPA: exodeoxyribonuclease V subunit alpha [Candidatus Binatia bacterium]
MITLAQLRAAGVLSPLDEQFALTLARLADERDPSIVLAAALASRQVGLGHTCLDLRRLVHERTLVAEGGERTIEIRWPELERWCAALRASPLVGAPDDPDEATPLVLDAQGRLYLRRYWSHEQRLAAAIRARASDDGQRGGARNDELEAALDRLFGPASASPEAPPSGATPVAVPSAPPAPSSTARSRGARDDRQLALQLDAPSSDARSDTSSNARPDASASRGDDAQRAAARTAATRRLCVISGGPGTGKTSTVVKILALLAEQRLRAGEPPPRALLLAPTGKAAMRLTESIRNAKAQLACDDEVRAAIPEASSTIHRALGVIEGSTTRFRHHRDNPLPADVVLVDEASMVDLALMARLVDAVPDEARLILLGDKDQLASVEAGAVLGELCAEPRDDGPLGRCIVHLTRSWRYRPGSGIEALARAINAGDAARALEIVADPAYPDVTRVDPARDQALSPALEAQVMDGFAPYFEASDAGERLRALERFRVLCAHRRGPHGVETANSEIESALATAGRIERGGGATYAGRPIIVTRNDYQLELFNGDVGTIVEVGGRKLAFFAAADGAQRLLSPARLPPHETVFAMTVHKSQGSEFDRVAVLLGDRPSPLMTRELLYTAVTRARQSVVLHATEEVIAAAVARPTERASGLRDALRG